MQTTQRKREEGSETTRGERAQPVTGTERGMRFASEGLTPHGQPYGSYGQGPSTAWGQVGLAPILGFSQGFPPTDPDVAHLRYPTSGFTQVPVSAGTAMAAWSDLVGRGLALAALQGQALLSAIQRPFTNGTFGNALANPWAGGAAMEPGASVGFGGARAPAVDIVDEGSEFVCQVELPGVKTENVDVSCFERGVLVTAHAEPEIDIGALVQAERGIKASYRRAINMPAPVQPSGAKATLRDGILTVNLPKSNPTEGPRRVPVNAGTP